jgi:CRP/FNR family transcriptional regulator, cyclic AMP receptor protein
MLLKYSKYAAFSPGEHILQQGEKSNALFIIIDGKALVTAKILGEGTTTIASLNRGDIFGEISLLENTPCVTSVTANTQVHCILITNTYFEMLSLFFQETKYKIIKAITEQICERLVNLYKKILKQIHQSDMPSRSIFGEVVRTLAKPTAINFEEAEIDLIQLQKSKFFSLFDIDEIAIILDHAKLVKAPKKCILIHEFAQDSPFYILLRGAVQSSIIENNIIAKLSVLGPYELFCSNEVIDSEKSAIINYTTCERAILLEISNSNLTLLQNTHPQLWYKIFDLICLSFIALEKSADKLDIRMHIELYNR